MVVNNLIVETLDPQNLVAQLYTTEYNDEERNYLINYWNNHIIGVKWSYDILLIQIQSVDQMETFNSNQITNNTFNMILIMTPNIMRISLESDY